MAKRPENALELDPGSIGLFRVSGRQLHAQVWRIQDLVLTGGNVRLGTCRSARERAGLGQSNQACPVALDLEEIRARFAVWIQQRDQ